MKCAASSSSRTDPKCHSSPPSPPPMRDHSENVAKTAIPKRTSCHAELHQNEKKNRIGTNEKCEFFPLFLYLAHNSRATSKIESENECEMDGKQKKKMFSRIYGVKRLAMGIFGTWTSSSTRVAHREKKRKKEKGM